MNNLSINKINTAADKKYSVNLSVTVDLQQLIHSTGKQMQALRCDFKNAGHPKTTVLLYITVVTDSHAVHSKLSHHSFTHSLTTIINYFSKTYSMQYLYKANSRCST